jgi:transcriptional regulator with XRE-family HTH domain
MIRDEDKPLAAAIGLRVRALRTKRGATQEQVAEWVNLSSQVYSRLERGLVLPSLPTLMRLATALAVDPGALLIAALPSPSLGESAPKYRVGGKRKSPEIGDVFGRLEPATQTVLLSLVRHLARQRP